MAIILRGWRYSAFIACIVGGITAAIYPIIIHPMMYPDEYKKAQNRNRAGIKQEEIQPGNMRVWSSPFEERKP